MIPITIDDLDKIVSCQYTLTDIIDAIAKFYNINSYSLISDSSKKFAFRPNVIFILRYFGISYDEISKVLQVNNRQIAACYKPLIHTFFKEKETIDLFLFVLSELRKTQTHERK
jgi:hypothetical protein